MFKDDSKAAEISLSYRLGLIARERALFRLMTLAKLSSDEAEKRLREIESELRAERAQ